jgi:hypothetical protein
LRDHKICRTFLDAADVAAAIAARDERIAGLEAEVASLKSRSPLQAVRA